MKTFLFLFFCIAEFPNPTPAFKVTEIRHPKEITDIRIIYEGKNIGVGDLIYSRNLDVTLHIEYKNKGRIRHQSIDMELYESPHITLLDFDIRENKLGDVILKRGN